MYLNGFEVVTLNLLPFASVTINLLFVTSAMVYSFFPIAIRCPCAGFQLNNSGLLHCGLWWFI
jgi:hypothetical protein